MRSILVSAMLLIKQRVSRIRAAWPQSSTVDVTCGTESRQLAAGRDRVHGVVGKKATVEVTQGGTLAGEPRGVVKAACGWQ